MVFLLVHGNHGLGGLVLPVNTIHRARVDCLLDEILRPPLGFDDLGLLSVFIHLKHLRADFLTGFTADTLSFIYVHPLRV